MYMPPDSVIRLQIKWQALFEFFPVCLVPMVFLFAAGATVGAVLSAEVVAMDPLGISGFSLG
jgi:hypothetical protein